MKDIILIRKSYKISGKYSKNNKPLKQSIFFPSRLYENVNLLNIMLKYYRKQNYKYGWYKRKCRSYFYKSKNNKHVLVQNNTKQHTLKLMKQIKYSGFFSKVPQQTILKSFILYRMKNNYSSREISLTLQSIDLGTLRKMHIPNGKIVI